jgi:hypothetical protein
MTNIVHKKEKSKISPLYKYVQCQSATVHGTIGKKIYIQYSVAKHAVLVCIYYLTVFSFFFTSQVDWCDLTTKQ